MEIDDVDVFVEGAAARYRAFTLSLQGALNRAFDARSLASAATRDVLRREILSAATSYVESESKHLSAQSQWTAQEANQSVLSALGAVFYEQSMLAEHNRQQLDHVLEALKAQVRRDIRATQGLFTRSVLWVDMMRRREGVSDRYARMHVRARDISTHGFEFRDRSGKRWQSERYIKTLLRGHLIDVYNDTLVLLLLGGNQRLARIHAPGHARDGELLTLIEQDKKLLSYSAVRTQVFHPNTRALVAPSVSH